MLRGGSGRSRGPALKGIWDELRDTVPPTPHDGVSQPRTCRQTSSPVSPRLCRACPALRGPPFRIGPQPHCVPAPACRPSRGQRCAQLGSPWMDARAPVGSPHCLIWGSRLRKVRGGVPSDLFKGLAASRLPPPSAYTPCVAQCRLIPFPLPDSIASLQRSERREQLLSSRPSLLVFLSRGGGGGRESAGLCSRFADCV